MQNPLFNVTVDLTGWLGELQRDLDALLGDLMQVCRAADEQKYSENIAEHRFGPMRLVLPNSETLALSAPERAARACFLGAVGKFISFIDRLIASQRVTLEGIIIDRSIAGNDELNKFLLEYMDGQIARVARDLSLTNPKKIGCFPGVPELVKDAALAYFALRRTLEHHQDIPKEEISIPLMRFGFFIEDDEVKELPAMIGPGQSLLGRTVIEHRKFAAGVRADLSPQDAFGVTFAIRNIMAPEILQAHIEAGKPSRIA